MSVVSDPDWLGEVAAAEGWTEGQWKAWHVLAARLGEFGVIRIRREVDLQPDHLWLEPRSDGPHAWAGDFADAGDQYPVLAAVHRLCARRVADVKAASSPAQR